MSSIIGIYPGAFQPPHKGHLQAFDFLKQYTGENSFIATTDMVEMPNAPLNFQDKQQIWTKHGVPIDKVIKVKDPYKAVEITRKFGPDRTVAIFAMSKKDADNVLKTSNGYFQPFQGMDQTMEPMSKKVYVMTTPDVNEAINKNFTPERIRQAFSSMKLTDEQKKSFFKQIFGWYDISLYDLMTKKFKEASVVKERLNESSIMYIRRALKPIVKEIMREMVYPSGQDTTVTTSTPNAAPEISPADAAKAEKEKKAAKEKELKAAERKLKIDRSELKYHDDKSRELKRYTLPTSTKAIQNLKKP